MEADELQRVWQSQERGRQITVDADLVLNLVRRNDRNFRCGIFWRDVREVGAALFLVAFFIYQGVSAHSWPAFPRGRGRFVRGTVSAGRPPAHEMEDHDARRHTCRVCGNLAG